MSSPYIHVEKSASRPSNSSTSTNSSSMFASACQTPPMSVQDLPGTPPPPKPEWANKPPAQAATAEETTSSRSRHLSHKEYMDSLQPPSQSEFIRLSKLQEEREQEHRERNDELRRQNDVLARKTMEARRDFMKTKAHLEDEDGAHEGDVAGEARRYSPFGHRHSRSGSRSRISTSRDGNDAPRPSTADSAGDGSSLRGKAAIVIQRSYRGYRVRREMQGLGLDASTRWTHAIRDAQWRELNRPRARESQQLSIAGTDQTIGEDGNAGRASKSHARQNWMKAAAIARRAGADEDSDHSDASESYSPDSEDWAEMTAEERKDARKKREEARVRRRKHARTMGIQYFLEMVDLQHRYGSNLRTYHEEWKRSKTNENFFYWLDYGEGKNIEVEACPRDRLAREQVRYLSREERQHYLVQVDKEGRLCWAKNGARIDTTEEWKDSIHGIVPVNDPTPAFSPEIEKHSRGHPQDRPSSSSSSSSRESELEAARAAKYANADLDETKGMKKIKHVSAATIFNKLLRKSVKKNTWIFVADTAFRLYVGIKASGAFQHSSFLQGARISAAGLIKVKNGRLSSLSPLSGHYRPPAANFRAFVHSLEDEGVDMSHVSISRSYAVLVGLEVYLKGQRKGKEALQKLRLKKTKVLQPEEAKKIEEEAWDKSQSAEKERRFLERERKKEEEVREENKATVKLFQKMHINPRTPAGQADGNVEGGEDLDAGNMQGVPEVARAVQTA